MKIRNYRIWVWMGILGLLLSCSDQKVATSSPHYYSVSKKDFVGSKQCRSCHQAQFNAWKDSDHDLAMMVADSVSVKGNFDDFTYFSKGVKYYFHKKNGRFFVGTKGRDGAYQDFEVKYTFGFFPLQQYLVLFEKGRLQALHVAWDSRANKWFDLHPDMEFASDEWMHWTGGSMTWNNMCADCHSTFVQKNYNPDSDEYQTSFAEVDVSCEACHGPGKSHIAYYKDKNNKKNYHPMQMSGEISSRKLVDQCARCHSRRSMLTNSYDFSGGFDDYYTVNEILPPAYHEDGQILDEDYVYGSFLQSKMYHKGVSCIDCHDPHTLKLKKKGNALCLQCHDQEYDSPAHHFHPISSTGAKCVSCHMPGKYYMQNDFRRDHSFRIPRTDLSVKYGVPNACTSCHTEKQNQWAVDVINKKFGYDRPAHFSEILIPAVLGNSDDLLQIFKAEGIPKIVESSAIGLVDDLLPERLRRDVLIPLLRDSAAMVRREALNSMPQVNGENLSLVENLLNDPVRSVRVAAARYFIIGNIKTTSPYFEKAKKDYLTFLKVNSDFASGQHQWALYYQATGQKEAARSAYRRALAIDNYFNMSRMNLALMEYIDGHPEVADSLYRIVINQEPDYSQPYYMLGLLHNEMGHTDLALKYLKLATEKQPLVLRAFYNYSLLLYQKEKYTAAEKIIDKGLLYDPLSEDLLYMKLLIEIRKNEIIKAIEVASKLQQINPGNTRYQKIIDQLEAGKK